MFLYSIAIKIYILFIYLAAPFYSKAKKAVAGRKRFFLLHRPTSDTYIWFHCASLGEFEQGRPLIEKIKKEFPHKKILLSFFSPSGYEIRKNYPLADLVIYLPFDSAANAKLFFKTFNIEMAIFVKYDVWPFYLKRLIEQKIPVFLTSAVFRKDHFFFRWYGTFMKKMMQKINVIFVQNIKSKEIAESFGFSNVQVAGDVRIDRVIQIRNDCSKMPAIENFLNGEKCVVFGSVYDSDEPIIQTVKKNVGARYKIIIAPHKTEVNEIKKFQQKFPGSILFANLHEHNSERILLIDHVGSLNQIYQYAEAVYIGGGFENGIHNILEPAVFNIPVFFGPEHKKFSEANSFVENELAFFNTNPLILAKSMISSLEKSIPLFPQKKSQDWFAFHSGATDIIFKSLVSFFDIK